MFQFRRFPTYTYLIQCTLHGYCPCGLPHSEIRGSTDICSFPRLIAACHVLRRLLMPRHSPCALSSLTCSSQSPLCSVSALRRKLRPLPCSSLPTQTRFTGLCVGFGDGRCGLLRELSEKSWFSQELCRLHRLFEIVIVTLRPSGRCSTINFCHASAWRLSVALLITCVALFSFQGADSDPFKIRNKLLIS